MLGSVRQVFGMNIPVTPNLGVTMNDSRHYQPVCSRIYRFTPVLVHAEDLARVHGVNERLSLEACKKMVQFNILLMERWAQSEEVLS